MDLILSTRNPKKVEQIRAMFAGTSVKILTLEDAGVTGEAVEDGDTLGKNAMKKAIFAQEHTGKWSIADDAGVFIDALNGQPGVHSARWAGRDASTEDVMRFTLEKLKHVLPGKRTATFRTEVILMDPQAQWWSFVGEAPGTILTAPRGPCRPKMPYSSIFVPDGQPKVWAEMSVEEENAISHRGKAFIQARNFLHELFGN